MLAKQFSYEEIQASLSKARETKSYTSFHKPMLIVVNVFVGKVNHMLALNEKCLNRFGAILRLKLKLD